MHELSQTQMTINNYKCTGKHIIKLKSRFSEIIAFESASSLMMSGVYIQWLSSALSAPPGASLIDDSGLAYRFLPMF